jgi:hypothetical protein
MLGHDPRRFVREAAPADLFSDLSGQILCTQALAAWAALGTVRDRSGPDRTGRDPRRRMDSCGALQPSGRRPMMLDDIFASLFPNGHSVEVTDGLILGAGPRSDGGTIHVLGIAAETHEPAR